MSKIEMFITENAVNVVFDQRDRVLVSVLLDELKIEEIMIH